jgi:hypothetical protein
MNSSLRSISNNQQSLKCGSTTGSFYSLLRVWAFQFSLTLVPATTLISRLKALMVKGALLICQGGPDVSHLLLQLVVSSKEAWSNDRFRLGMAVGMVAFPAWKCHIFFDITARNPEWYFVNWVFYLNTIRPYLSAIFLSAGLFICAPQKWGFRWVALPVVVFCISEIVSQSFYTNWTDFYQPMPAWEICLLILAVTPAFMFSMDYLLYRKYHLKDGNAARVLGIMQLDIPWDEKKKHLETLKEEMENYNARI